MISLDFSKTGQLKTMLTFILLQIYLLLTLIWISKDQYWSNQNSCIWLQLSTSKPHIQPLFDTNRLRIYTSSSNSQTRLWSEDSLSFPRIHWRFCHKVEQSLFGRKREFLNFQNLFWGNLRLKEFLRNLLKQKDVRGNCRFH